MNTVRLNTKLIKTLSDVLLIPPARMMKEASIANSTWYYIMEHPDGISVQQLLAFANGLHIPVRRFFSSTRADLIGQREDYVTDPYLECRYDDATLQRMVNASPSATWQKAAKAINMSRSRLRDSLLTVTRTPVVRFLKVCEVFDIDPFTILVDPNPEVNRKKRSNTTASDDTFRAEIAALSRKVEDLTDTIACLTDKYQALLERHNQLENSVHSHFGFGTSVGIAADSPNDDAG